MGIRRRGSHERLIGSGGGDVCKEALNIGVRYKRKLEATTQCEHNGSGGECRAMDGD